MRKTVWAVVMKRGRASCGISFAQPIITAVRRGAAMLTHSIIWATAMPKGAAWRAMTKLRLSGSAFRGNGYAPAQRRAALALLYGIGVERNASAAVGWLEKAAQQGDISARCDLGSCYYFGAGVEKNRKRAFRCFREAALKGSIEAMNNVGYCFRFGQGVMRNEKKAFGCFRTAARRGYAGAQHNLGRCYLEGCGVARDEEQARLWLERAAQNGYRG